MRTPFLVLTLVACGSSIPLTSIPSSAPPSPEPDLVSDLPSALPPSRDETPFAPSGFARCPGAAATRDATWICPDEAPLSSLTIVDLADAWTPTLFAVQPDGTEPNFRATYLELAADPLQLTELNGVVPSLAIVRERLADDARHECHDALLENQEVIDIETAQRHLVCEGFLAKRDAKGSMTRKTAKAIELFQRRNFLMPTKRLDEETRTALSLDSRELDYRLALRILRERVIDATGLIEDGTASDGPQPILGRVLDPAVMRAARGHQEPLPDGAPDLIGPAVEAAAVELGWTDAEGVRAFLDRHDRDLRVALALPRLPAYHSTHMDLSAELDRGDVYYDETPTHRWADRRPTVTLFVTDNGIRRPLVRWPTTIGGWAHEQIDGRLVQKWKESEVGPRVWRTLYAAPTWLPPASTPDRELVTQSSDGDWKLLDSIFGPGPLAAYGLVLLVHEYPVTRPDGTIQYRDNDIGSHGSSSVTSIVNGTSHGCHRMFNQLAIRLGNFLLRHRDHIVRGEQVVEYRRTVKHHGTFDAAVDTRGFLYELTPPVPIDVLEGNILSERQIPPENSAPADE